MHGLIHVVFKEFVVETYGDESWVEVIRRVGIKCDSIIMEMKQYDDKLTFSAVQVACEVLGVSMELALEQLGAYFLVFALRQGYRKQLEALGKNLMEMISNLNLLHQTVERDLPTAIFPVLSVASEEETPDYFLMKYSSTRKGLEPLLRGVLVKVADQLFNADLDIESTGSVGILAHTDENEVVLRLRIRERRGERSIEQKAENTRRPGMKKVSFFCFHQCLASSLRGQDKPQQATAKGAVQQQTYESPGVKRRDSGNSTPSSPSSLRSNSWLGLPAGRSSRRSATWDAGRRANWRLDSARRLKTWLGFASSATTDTVRRSRSLTTEDKPEVLPTLPTLLEGQAPDEQPDVRQTLSEGRKDQKLSTVNFATNASQLPAVLPSSRPERITVAKTLFRGVPAHKIAAPWTDSVSLHSAKQFWSAYDRLSKYFTWSADFRRKRGSMNTKMIRFLSHSWSEPHGWSEIMGDVCSFAEVKAAELCSVSKELAARHLGDATRWHEIHYWVDKCCIPQGHPELMRRCVALMEEFIQLSDGLVVIVTWSYFERLWCVYEWACFLVCHDSRSITLSAETFMRFNTTHLLVASIRQFSLENCKCAVEADRAVLYRKVDEYYVSRESFESFLKFTAIALIARDMAVRRASLGREAISPWAELAETCGFESLAARLWILGDMAMMWRKEAAYCLMESLGATEGYSHFVHTPSVDIQTMVAMRADAWFLDEIEPLINERRHASTYPNAFKPASIVSAASPQAMATVVLNGNVDIENAHGQDSDDILRSEHSCAEPCALFGTAQFCSAM